MKRYKATLAFIMIGSFALCGSALSAADPAPDPVPDLDLSGEQLVKAFCIRCHLAPEPSELPKETWPWVVSWMGNFLGIPDFSINERLGRDYIGLYKAIPGMVPEQPMISRGDFKRLKEYLVANARPESEMVVKRPRLAELTGFEIAIPKLDLPGNNMLLGLAVDERNQRLYTGSALENNAYLSAFRLGDGKRVGHIKLDAGARSIEQSSKGLRIGTIAMDESTYSKTLDISRFETASPRVHTIINDDCPVQTANQTRDLNGDGLEDVLSGCFGSGNRPGHMLVYWQTKNYERLWPTASLQSSEGMVGAGAFRKTSLAGLIAPLWGEGYSSVVSATIEDFNKDGRPDILVFIVNGRQQLILLVNKGNEQFERTVVAEFAPSAGGVTVAGKDFDRDGYPEIVMNLGNNEELSDLKPVRPYHGIYVFHNNRDLTFTQKFFQPMQGSVKSVVEDFDGDGDMDIATVALEVYTGSEHSESFVYLENRGDWRFDASTVPESYPGRWINIATGDVNGDGHPDIVLGDGSGYPWNAAGEDEYYRRRLGKRKEYAPVVYLINRHF